MEYTVLNTEDAAKRIGIAVSTLEKSRVNGTGPQYIKLGRLVRYRVSDLDEWIASRLVRSTSEPAAALNAA